MLISVANNINCTGKLLLISITVSLSLDIFLTYWINKKRSSLRNEYFSMSIKMGMVKSVILKVAVALLLIFSIIGSNLNTYKLSLPVFIHFVFLMGMLLDYFRGEKHSRG